MTKTAKVWIILLSAVLVLVCAAAVGLKGFWQPYQLAASTMPATGQMILTAREDGSQYLTWDRGSNHDRYLVRVLRGQQILMQTWVREEGCILQGLPQGENLEICIQTARGYRFLFGKEERIRMGEGECKATVDLKMPALENLTQTPDPDTQTVKIEFPLENNCVARMYRVDASGELTGLHTLEEGTVTVTLGDGGEFPVPELGQQLCFAFDVYRTSPGLVYYGTVCQQTSILREDMLQRDLNLTCTDLGGNMFCFTWGETKGEHYRLQQWDPASDGWQTLCRVEPDGERTYTTGQLASYTDYRFRAVAVGGQTLPDSEFAAISQEVTIKTEATAVFCTVWPIQELELYQDPQKSQVLGKAEAAVAYCVLAQEEGMFRIRVGQQEGYVDSGYCLINLPEYLGDICLYQIANSSRSLYAAHEYELPGVTGKVILGYEKVQMRSGEQLVPLLYPVAQRLEKAAFAAIEQGYKLKIYDAYRPRKATKALYDLAIGLKDQPIPETTYKGGVMEDLPVLEEGQVLTYGNLMTDFGRYTMNYFLANGKSRHNRGIALDLTLVDLSTGKDLRMQTAMHDLSWYSENARDNKNARTLASIMEGVGFTGLKSEWWHFHDLDVQDSLQPEYQMKGVTPACWMADEKGWRYRKDNGEYYVNCTATIEGQKYTFDDQGYALDA